MVDSPSKTSVLKIENERIKGGFFEMRFDCSNTELGFSIHIIIRVYEEFSQSSFS